MIINIMGANALIEIEKPATKTEGGIDIPEEAQVPNMFGRVVAVGRRERLRPINQNDVVLFSQCRAVDPKILQSLDKTKEYVLVRQEDIYATIEEEPVKPMNGVPTIEDNTFNPKHIN